MPDSKCTLENVSLAGGGHERNMCHRLSGFHIGEAEISANFPVGLSAAGNLFPPD